MKISKLIEALEKVKYDEGDVEVIIMHHLSEYDCEPDLFIRSDGKTICISEGEYTEETVKFFKANPKEDPRTEREKKLGEKKNER